MAKNFVEVFFRQVRRDQIPVLELFNPFAVIVFNDTQRLTALPLSMADHVALFIGCCA